MKLENVLRVMLMVLVGLFICISIDFGVVLASTKSLTKIAEKMYVNEKPDNQFSDDNEVDKNYSESINEHQVDFLNLKESGKTSDYFTPGLYRWLWKNIPTQ